MDYVNISTLEQLVDITTLTPLQSLIFNVTEVFSTELNDWNPEVNRQIIRIVLLSACFGLFTLLTIFATVTLVWKGLKRSTVFMLIVTITMYLSTTTYWVAVLMLLCRTYGRLTSEINAGLHRLLTMESCLSDDSSASCGASAQPFNLIDSYPTWKCQFAATAAFTINVFVGDAIAVWRAWILWRKRREVSIICTVLVLSTFVCGLVDTAYTYHSRDLISFISPSGDGEKTAAAGWLFEGNVWGLATSVLSLITNLFATALIGYRAWEHRRFVRSYLTKGSRRTKVEKVLALLTESGIAYCLIWILVVAQEVISYTTPRLGRVSSPFAYGLDCFMGGVLVPLIPTYPMLIIILVALKKSHCEWGFTYWHDGGDDDDKARVHRAALPLLRSIVFRRDDPVHTLVISSASGASDARDAKDPEVAVKDKDGDGRVASHPQGDDAVLSLSPKPPGLVLLGEDGGGKMDAEPEEEDIVFAQ